jgi:hypothetical protein
MKTSSRWNFSSIMGRFIAGFVLALMICSINVAPALSKDHDRRMENNDQDRYERDRHRKDRVRYERQRRGYERPIYERRRRGYEPPPVIYVPPPAPGIRIFFPPIIIHP